MVFETLIPEAVNMNKDEMEAFKGGTESTYVTKREKERFDGGV